MEEKYGLTEQAVNKMVEFALSRHVKQTDHLEARLKFTWGRLAQGEVESILIRIHGFFLPQSLRTEALQLQIGQVRVVPLLALKGKIQLVQPATGYLEIALNQTDLTQSLNHALRGTLQNQAVGLAQTPTILEHVECFLENRHQLIMRCQFRGMSTAQQVDLMATLQANQQQGLVLTNVQGPEAADFSQNWIATLVEQMNQILNLRFFAQNGMNLAIEKAEITGKKLLIQANTRIEFFPS